MGNTSDDDAAAAGPPADSPTALSNTEPALRRAWHPVARSEDIGSTPAKVWLLGRAYVVFRIDGTLFVLDDECPHRLAPLSAGRIVDGTLECAYHGWRFDGSGRCTLVPSLGSGRIPSRAQGRAPFGITERYGLVFVALESPIVDLPEIRAFDDPERVRVDCEPFSGEFGAGFLIDNQLDMAHFAYLHRNTFGTAEATVTPNYEVEREAWGFTVDTDIAIAASNDPGVADGVRPLEQYRHMHYHYLAPFHVELRLDYPIMGGSTVITFFVQPETERRSTMYVSLLFAQPGGFDAHEVAARVAFEYQVIGEDLDLQSKFDVAALPLELTRECHVRSDRASVEFRRLLRSLVEAASRAPELPGEDDGVDDVDRPRVGAGRA